MHLRHWLALSLLASCLLRADEPAWSLVWADEFDAGPRPDSTRWAYDLGGNGWGNNELQSYTSRTNNVRVENGHLVIEARRENFTATDGIARNYTSARLKTKGKAAWTYGRIEARLQVPRGQGIWPAFWMLGANIGSVPWPGCGEIDVMENIGREPAEVHGTIHGPGYSGADGIGKSFKLAGGKVFADDFHLFAVEWETNRLRWSVDGQPYFTVTPASLPAGKTWVYTQPQFLLLNVAVGGNWPGAPDGTTAFPQRLRVDYVRVYARTSAPIPRVQLQVEPDRIEARWPLTFPHARLEQAFAFSAPWKPVATTGTRRGGELAEAVPEGFYRLRWTP